MHRYPARPRPIPVRSAILALLLCVPAASPSHAQSADRPAESATQSAPGQAQTPAPEALAEQYFAAIRAQDAGTLGMLHHPEAAAAFRGQVWPTIEREFNCGNVAPLQAVFGPQASFIAIAAVEPRRFLGFFLERFLAITREAGLIIGETKVLGTVREGDTLLHVLNRARVSSGKVSSAPVVVLTLRRDADGQGFLVSSEAESYAGQLLARILSACRGPAG